MTVLYKKVNPKDIRNMKDEIIKILLHKLNKHCNDMGHSLAVAVQTYADELSPEDINELENLDL